MSDVVVTRVLCIFLWSPQPTDGEGEVEDEDGVGSQLHLGSAVVSSSQL